MATDVISVNMNNAIITSNQSSHRVMSVSLIDNSGDTITKNKSEISTDLLQTTSKNKSSFRSNLEVEMSKGSVGYGNSQSLHLTTDPMVVTLIETGEGSDETYYKCVIRYQDYKIQLPRYQIAPKWGTTIKLILGLYDEISRNPITPSKINVRVFFYEKELFSVNINPKDRLRTGLYEIPYTIPDGVDILRLEATCEYKGYQLTDSTRMSCSQ